MAKDPVAGESDIRRQSTLFRVTGKLYKIASPELFCAGMPIRGGRVTGIRSILNVKAVPFRDVEIHKRLHLERRRASGFRLSQMAKPVHTIDLVSDSVQRGHE